MLAITASFSVIADEKIVDKQKERVRLYWLVMSVCRLRAGRKE
jgi:hypothetical protein